MNPTGQPMGTPMPSAPSGAAKELLNLPSLFIIILGALGGLLILSSMVNQLAGGSQRMLESLIASMPADQRDQMGPLIEMANKSQGGGVVWSVICLGLAGFVVFAGLQMRSLKNWGVCLAGAILVMIPCSTSCCCCLGIPVGIWALITLTKPEVKSAFS